MASIRVRDLGKRYEIYVKPVHRIANTFFPNPRWRREFWALRHVYLELEEGSTLGIIGHNGAGKSTLLRILTGISRPSEGEVEVRGRVSSLLEPGAGFHHEFSGWDNIRLHCTLLGMSPEEILETLPSIAAFSELGDFLDLPIKSYSTGMFVRLGFAVAAMIRPDVLIVDEALAVGDEYFRGKCLNRINELRDEGATICFVSHDLGMIRNLCDRVILLDKGLIVGQGTADDVADAYLKHVHARREGEMRIKSQESVAYPRWGSGEIEVTKIDMTGGDGAVRHVFRPGEAVAIRFHYTVHQAVRDPVFGVGIYRSDRTYVNGSNHVWRREPLHLTGLRPGDRGIVSCRIARLPLLQGSYYLTSFLYEHGVAAPTPIDHQEHCLTFEIVDDKAWQHGLCALETAWVEERHPAGARREEPPPGEEPPGPGRPPPPTPSPPARRPR